MRNICASRNSIDSLALDAFAYKHPADDYVAFTLHGVSAVAVVNPVIPEDPNDYRWRCRNRTLMFATPECAYFEIYVHYENNPVDMWLFLTYGKCVSYSAIFDSFRESYR